MKDDSHYKVKSHYEQTHYQNTLLCISILNKYRVSQQKVPLEITLWLLNCVIMPLGI